MKILKTRTFSLVELIVVIAVITVMAAILLPGLSRARNLALRTKCASNLRQIGMGMHMYADDNRDQFPDISAGGFSALVAPNGGYMPDGPIWGCPSVTTYEPTASTSPYFYYYFNYSSMPDSETTLLVGESTKNHLGGRVNRLYVDGHVAIREN